MRRKQRTGSLSDGAGRPASEALLSGALSGIGRDAYRTMFSLDDETLEEGGNAILQSRGDLGELLFSASAGLAQIGATLAKASEEADAIHKKRARSTEIAGLKQRLAELKARRGGAGHGRVRLCRARPDVGAPSRARDRDGRARPDQGRPRPRVAALEGRADAHQYRAVEGELAAYDGLPPHPRPGAASCRRCAMPKRGSRR